MKTNRRMEALGLLAFLPLIGKCKKNALEIVQIYGASVFLKGVQIAHDFFLYHMGILICVLFVVFGIIAMEAAVIFYVPIEASTRGILIFTLGSINFLAGFILLKHFASSKRWLSQASKYNAWIKTTIETRGLK